ncbi:hypothetical protein DFH07DRAFT_768707 [Mycena maculata]|uniref:Uncharacterized protein n=1 Tax=Mycena maculata TaxID=230809 RepID=A0AAD7JRS9_9AGAR|nr:hypothetical protein DFH07DRAFT_768707 [Mycena maculata]
MSDTFCWAGHALHQPFDIFVAMFHVFFRLFALLTKILRPALGGADDRWVPNSALPYDPHDYQIEGICVSLDGTDLLAERCANLLLSVCQELSEMRSKADKEMVQRLTELIEYVSCSFFSIELHVQVHDFLVEQPTAPRPRLSIQRHILRHVKTTEDQREVDRKLLDVISCTRPGNALDITVDARRLTEADRGEHDLDEVFPMLRSTQMTLDFAQETAGLHVLMRDALAQSSDVEMFSVAQLKMGWIQVGYAEMPEALKTLRRALERVGGIVTLSRMNKGGKIPAGKLRDVFLPPPSPFLVSSPLIYSDTYPLSSNLRGASIAIAFRQFGSTSGFIQPGTGSAHIEGQVLGLKSSYELQLLEWIEVLSPLDVATHHKTQQTIAKLGQVSTLRACQPLFDPSWTSRHACPLNGNLDSMLNSTFKPVPWLPINIGFDLHISVPGLALLLMWAFPPTPVNCVLESYSLKQTYATALSLRSCTIQRVLRHSQQAIFAPKAVKIVSNPQSDPGFKRTTSFSWGAIRLSFTCQKPQEASSFSWGAIRLSFTRQKPQGKTFVFWVIHIAYGVLPRPCEGSVIVHIPQSLPTSRFVILQLAQLTGRIPLCDAIIAPCSKTCRLRGSPSKEFKMRIYTVTEILVALEVNSVALVSELAQ